MISAWNDQIKIVFIPPWVSYLDESMSVWINKFALPGFIFCPINPYPKGSDYRTIWCCGSCIMYSWYVVEGSYHLITICITDSDTSPNINTVVIILHLTRALWITRKAVIIVSILCFLKVLLEMSRRWVYGISLIKNRLYWPRGNHGYGINKYFSTKNIVGVRCLSGK